MTKENELSENQSSQAKSLLSLCDDSDGYPMTQLVLEQLSSGLAITRDFLNTEAIEDDESEEEFDESDDRKSINSSLEQSFTSF